MGTKFKLPMPSREDIFYASKNNRVSYVENLLYFSKNRPIGLFWDHEDEVTREPMCPVVGFLTGVGVDYAKPDDAKIYAYDPSYGSSTYYKYCALLDNSQLKHFKVIYIDECNDAHTGYVVGSPATDESREFTSLEIVTACSDGDNTRVRVDLKNIAYLIDIKTGIKITEDTNQNG